MSTSTPRSRWPDKIRSIGRRPASRPAREAHGAVGLQSRAGIADTKAVGKESDPVTEDRVPSAHTNGCVQGRTGGLWASGPGKALDRIRLAQRTFGSERRTDASATSPSGWISVVKPANDRRSIAPSRSPRPGAVERGRLLAPEKQKQLSVPPRRLARVSPASANARRRRADSRGT
jgi:hypothetical protein